jgi:hypothetical protein
MPEAVRAKPCDAYSSPSCRFSLCSRVVTAVRKIRDGATLGLIIGNNDELGRALELVGEVAQRRECASATHLHRPARTMLQRICHCAANYSNPKISGHWAVARAHEGSSAVRNMGSMDPSTQTAARTAANHGRRKARSSGTLLPLHSISRLLPRTSCCLPCLDLIARVPA